MNPKSYALRIPWLELERGKSQQRRTQVERDTSAGDFNIAAEPRENRLRPKTASNTGYSTFRSGRALAFSEDAFNISP